MNIEKDILKMYDLVFEDCVKCVMENFDEEELKEKNLTDDEIKTIAHRLIYNNDYLWETINEIIYNEIDYAIEQRD